jgi:hypothetical protein
VVALVAARPGTEPFGAQAGAIGKRPRRVDTSDMSTPVVCPLTKLARVIRLAFVATFEQNRQRHHNFLDR